jgi:hypothetical protein
MRLPRLLLIAVATGALGALGGCVEPTDERPATFEYIVDTILRPSCATATCHNSMTRREGLSFDSYEEARETFRREPLVTDIEVPENNQLIQVVTVSADNEFIPRMPIDGPLPEANIELMRKWILNGAVR